MTTATGFKLERGWLGPSADTLLDTLDSQIAWEEHTITMFGRTVRMPRQIAFYGPTEYSYSGICHPPRALPDALLSVQERLRVTLGEPFDAVLLNRYRDGQDAMGWHSDDDYKGASPTIASISLGATRRFLIRSKSGGPSIRLDLAHGDLLTMDGDSQLRYQHCLPRTQRVTGLRVNLTWRCMGAGENLSCDPTPDKPV